MNEIIGTQSHDVFFPSCLFFISIEKVVFRDNMIHIIYFLLILFDIVWSLKLMVKLGLKTLCDGEGSLRYKLIILITGRIELEIGLGWFLCASFSLRLRRITRLLMNQDAIASNDFLIH